MPVRVLGSNIVNASRAGAYSGAGAPSPPAGNGLLNGLREVWEPSGGVMVGRKAGLNLTNVNGATVDADGLQLSHNLSQYATHAANVLFQFAPGVNYTLMTTFKMTSLPEGSGDKAQYGLLNKGGVVNPIDWSTQVEAHDNGDSSLGPSIALLHNDADNDAWQGSQLYTPQSNHLYVAFSYFESGTPTTGVPIVPDSITTRLYSAGESVLETTTPIYNDYPNGSFNGGEALFVGCNAFNP